jgi:hypothetical protein
VLRPGNFNIAISTLAGTFTGQLACIDWQVGVNGLIRLATQTSLTSENSSNRPSDAKPVKPGSLSGINNAQEARIISLKPENHRFRPNNCGKTAIFPPTRFPIVQ